MSVDVKINSRLNIAELVKLDEIEFFEHVVSPDFPEEEDDVKIVIEDGMRLDLIAYQYYGDPNLIWVILQANDIFCYPFGMYIGKTIRLPHRSRIIGKILKAGE